MITKRPISVGGPNVATDISRKYRRSRPATVTGTWRGGFASG